MSEGRPALDRVSTAEFLRRLKGVRQSGSGWVACCPAHKDGSPSLSITETGTGRTLLHCFAGCLPENVCKSVGFALAQLMGDDSRPPAAAPAASSADPDKDWRREAERYLDALTASRRAQLAAALRLPAWALDALPLLGFGRDRHGNYWTFPECDADGAVVGINRRYLDGGKYHMPGSKRGLTVPALWRPRAEALKVVLIVEGGSDVLAASAAGLAALGRPSASGGKHHLVGLLRDLPAEVALLVVGENDRKEDGSWPGREGAEKMARELSRELRRAVCWALPPQGSKDTRAFLTARVQPGDTRPQWQAAGDQLLAALQSGQAVVECLGGGGVPPGDRPVDIEAIPLPPPRPRLPAAAYYGILGDIVRLIEPHTEADPAGILLQLLAAAGNAIGRGPYVQVEGDRHHTNLFVMLVGDTSNGRKGTSYGRAKQVMGLAVPDWAAGHVRSGLTTGEGVIEHVRDRRVVGGEVVDAGSEVKNVLAFESEFFSVIKRMGQNGNTLSPILRQAWDCHTLASMSKQSPGQASEALISVVGHITEAELKGSLGQVDVLNGFANRFLWAVVERVRELPDGGDDLGEPLRPLTENLGIAIGNAAQVGRVQRSNQTRATWHAAYSRLTARRPGPGGAIVARGPAHVLRLALIYTLLDGEDVIGEEQLQAALAVWDYCQASALGLFGDGVGVEDVGGRLLAFLRQAGPSGLTRTELNQRLGGHTTAGEIVTALADLRDRQLATVDQVPTGGRPREVWRAVGAEGGGLIPHGETSSADLFRSENASGQGDGPFSAFSAAPAGETAVEGREAGAEDLEEGDA